MASDYRKGPPAVHPETPSAVGSRNSMNRDGRDEYVESRLVIDEEVDKILNHIQSKLPPEVLEDITVQGNIKGYLHTYFNQSLQNMLNRYLTTAEDEMAKKVRDTIDKDEHANLNRYTPREISMLLNSIGGPELFNTEEVEKSIVNIMGHLQGHTQRGVYEFEATANAILMQRTDVGGFISGENTYTVIKASFRDNYEKPEEVVDVKLAINVLDSELISRIVMHQTLTEHLIKDVIASHIYSLVDREIDEINQQLQLEGRAALSNEEAIFEKFKAVENYTDDDEGETSKRYRLLPKHFLDRMKDLGSELNTLDPDYDPLSVKDGIAKLLEENNIRTRGWHTAINSITAILDTSRMGYQHIENYKHARRLVIREYEETDLERLPDERYEIQLRYYEARQIREDQAAYSAQLNEFQREILRLWGVVEEVYKEEKARSGWRDWDDMVVSTLERGRPGRRTSWFQTPAEEEGEEKAERVWNEITFVQRKLTSLEEMNQTYEQLIQEFEERFRLLRKRLHETFEMRFPNNRVIIEQRLNFLESEFLRFMSNINPYHVQPGLLLEVAITSIKRKKITIQGMTNVLNEFLSGISKGFSDRTVMQHERRRSNVTEGLGSFSQPVAE
ncbi:MAG: cytochrome C oxidase subunit II [SAR324 cluster bacterium]|nr:cytochrome C oxidase subunit II [SAR324 cluster bacterium]